MKKALVPLLFAVMLTLFTGCSSPDALQLDLSQGFGSQLKLLHLNASTSERRQRIEEFHTLLEKAQPLEKDFSMFAYYPDYRLELLADGQKTTVILDLNGEFVDFHYLDDTVLYRSEFTAQDLKKLIHQYA